MNALVASEFLKLRTTRTFFGVTGAGLGIYLLIVILAGSLADYATVDAPLEDLISGASFVALFALVIGILAISTEFRHKTVTPSLIATPDRTQWAISKLLANALAGAIFGLVAVGSSLLIVLLIFSIRGIDAGADVGKVIQIALGSALAAGLLAALGVGLGALVRNQVVAIVVAIVWLFILEPLLAGVVPALDEPLTKYGLGGLLNGVSGTDTSGDALGMLPSALLLALYAVIFLAAGIAMLQRRDVTGD